MRHKLKWKRKWRREAAEERVKLVLLGMNDDVHLREARDLILDRYLRIKGMRRTRVFPLLEKIETSRNILLCLVDVSPSRE